MAKLQNGVHLPPGSVEEVEIRGCSIQAVEVRVHSSLHLDSNQTWDPESATRPLQFGCWFSRRESVRTLLD